MRNERHRFDAVDQEQMAAQLVAVMDAHFQRPNGDEKRLILKLAEQQITSSEALPSNDEESLLQPSVHSHW
jgi:hypothetical protein